MQPEQNAANVEDSLKWVVGVLGYRLALTVFRAKVSDLEQVIGTRQELPAGPVVADSRFPQAKVVRAVKSTSNRTTPAKKHGGGRRAITDAQRAQIQELHKAGGSHREVAKQAGVSTSSVWKLLNHGTTSLPKKTKKT